MFSQNLPDPKPTMTPLTMNPLRVRRFLTPLLALSLAIPAWAQLANPTEEPKTETAPVPTTTAPAAKPKDKDKAKDEVLQLDPFTVTADNVGYQATNTMSGTRLNTKLEDLASSITVITKQQLLDTAAVDINDIFSNEGNTEGTFQYTAFTNDRGNIVDDVSQTPESANRVRGLGQANLASDGFARSRQIPVDTYNIDSVEISRGPNSNIFGLGESSGTVNLIRGRANITRDITGTSVRIDDRGSQRATLDINRVLWKDKAAVRIAALYDDATFIRKPSFDKTNRLTASLTLKPFENTTIRASYESYHNTNSRPNSTTPRDTLSYWRAAGSPVWDPTFSNNTGGWRLLNGTTYTAVTSGNEAAQLPPGINPQFTNFWNRPSLYVNPDGTIGRYEVNRTSTTASPGGANTQLRYMQMGTLIQRGGGAFGSVATPLYVQPGVSDKTIYDWGDVNYAAPNFQKRKADIYQFELEQWLYNSTRQKLALQLGYLREDISVASRAFIGAADGAPANIFVDINEKYLDGTANPYFLRPYFAGSEMQTFKRPEMNDNMRATLAYQLDLTQESGLLKWFGRHNVAAYGEFRQNIIPQNAYGDRYRDQIVAPESWWTAGNIANIPSAGAENRFFTRYYSGDAVNQPGQVIDYAGSAPKQLYGAQTLRYFNGVTQQWVNEEVIVGNAYFALGNQKTQIRTRGLVWQGYLAENRIIPTLGWRRDRVRSVNNQAAPLRPDGFIDENYLFIFPDSYLSNSGPTNTRGAVLVPFSGWSAIDSRADGGSKFFDALRTFRLHYNDSDSFQPAPSAYNVFGELLPNPTGKGKDYGFSFSALDGKLYVRFNKYNTHQFAARNGATAVIGTRPLRLDFDLSGDDAVFGDNVGGDNFDLEDTAFTWMVQLNPNLTLSQYATQVYGIMNVTQAYVDSLKNKVLSDINNVQSKGSEIEIYYNPTKYLTFKGTITQQQAIDTSISPNIQRYIDARYDTWTTVRVPTTLLPNGSQLPGAGRLWWEYGSGGTGTNIPMNFYSVNVDAPYSLAVTNSGKPRPQTREWRANLTTNYKLAGLGTDNKWLKNMSVGGTVRWEDQATIGFLAGPASADGAVRRLDGSKPVYDKARYYADAMVSYNMKMFNDRISARFQLNIRNVLESGRLQVVGVNPDGTPWNYRIIDPRQFILTASFDL